MGVLFLGGHNVARRPSAVENLQSRAKLFQVNPMGPKIRFRLDGVFMAQHPLNEAHLVAGPIENDGRQVPDRVEVELLHSGPLAKPSQEVLAGYERLANGSRVPCIGWACILLLSTFSKNRRHPGATHWPP